MDLLSDVNFWKQVRWECSVLIDYCAFNGQVERNVSSRRGRIYATTAACDKDAIGCRGIEHLSDNESTSLEENTK